MMIRLFLILSVSAANPISLNVDKEASEKYSVVGDVIDDDGLHIHSSDNSNRYARLIVNGGGLYFSGSIDITGDHGHIENINIASIIMNNAPQVPQHGQSSNKNTPVCDPGPYLLKADCFCEDTNNGGVPCAAGLICKDGECLNKVCDPGPYLLKADCFCEDTNNGGVPCAAGLICKDGECLNKKDKHSCYFNDDLLSPKVDEDGQMSPHDTSALFKWDNNVIPYYYSDENVDVDDKEFIRSIMDRIQEKTCFQFEEKSKADLHDDKDAHCLEIVIEDNLCSGGVSGSVGRVIQRSRLQLYLSAHVTENGDDCGYKGLIIHELLHALGIAHTQRRNDRDNFIEVNFDNLDGASEEIKNQYRKCEECTLYDSIPYDCGSIMHYGTHYNNKQVIVPKGTCELYTGPNAFWTPDATAKDWELLNIIGNCNA